MKRTTHLTMALSLTLAFAIPAGPAVSARPVNHETVLDRHHLLYGTVIPNPPDAPHGAPGESYVCLSCHAIDTSSGTNRFPIERDCRACHHPDLHHMIYSAVIPDRTEVPYGAAGELYDCLSCHAIDTSSGNHRFLIERDCRACHHPTGAQTVEVDIKPGNKRNSFKLKSRGVLPVSILGSDDYDVAEIDVSSLLLQGKVAPLRSRLRKRAGGYMDLKLKFSSGAVQNALGNLQPGQTYDVWITGEFMDGTPILGSDSCVAVPLWRGKWFSWAMEAGESTEGSRSRVRKMCCGQHNNRQGRERNDRDCV
jgi:hypothetical protein